MSWARRLIEERRDRVVLYLPKGTPHKRWRTIDGSPQLADADWWTGSFRGYYVNLEGPFRRTPIGFDTNDHHLDIVVTPDLRWSLKDEDVFAERKRDGTFSHGLIEEIRREADAVAHAI